MKFIKILSIAVIAVALVLLIINRNSIQQYFNNSEDASIEMEEAHQHTHDHNHGDNHDHSLDQSHEQDTDHNHPTEHDMNHHQDSEVKPFYQGEIVCMEHGGGYTYLEIKEKTDMTFWIAVNRVEAKIGDFVMFQEELVAQNFYSKGLDKTFDEIMFASNLQYQVAEE